VCATSHGTSKPRSVVASGLVRCGSIVRAGGGNTCTDVGENEWDRGGGVVTKGGRSSSELAEAETWTGNLRFHNALSEFQNDELLFGGGVEVVG
jgi:hypothetical protein